jgi:hypothetical protein
MFSFDLSYYLKHDSNHAIKKSNINVLQSFDEIKLYSIPNVESIDANSNVQAQTNLSNLTNSTKLPRRNESMRQQNASDPTNGVNEPINEINLKNLLDQIVDNLSTVNVQNWFSSEHSFNFKQLNQVAINENGEFTAPNLPSKPVNLFDSIQHALRHIEFNLKRNSDFINELTKLLDTSRAIKQEAQLRKLLKEHGEEKLNKSNEQNDSKSTTLSPPASPYVSGSSESEKKRSKSKSFRGFPVGLSSPKSKSKEILTNSDGKGSSLLSPTSISTTPNSISLNNIDLNSSNKDQKLSQTLNQLVNSEINNSDYIELEIEVEKISYQLDLLFHTWSKLTELNNQYHSNGVDHLKYSIEFYSLLNNLNSSLIYKELEQSLFKLNWLITSKSGFSEPNWLTNVISLTPSTLDSFIGVNLLKNYYRYVKYDFVTYKLFTRQLQLIQICAVILNIIHRTLVFYKESSTLSSISNTFNGIYGGSNSNSNILNDPSNQSLLSFSFSADKFRPISWSANHVTLYNVENKTSAANATTPSSSSSNNQQPLARSPSLRRGQDRSSNVPSREEQIRQIKMELFVKDINELLKISMDRINIQASLTNRTGYFYIVNQSTGLVLQAVDFTSAYSLKEQIEQNQKRLQTSSIKQTSPNSTKTPASPTNSSSGGSSAHSKGPRFYLMPKKNTQQHGKKSSANASISSSLSTETADDEQLWYYYLINGCVANKVIRSGHCMAASSLNAKSPVCFWPNVKTTNCSWFFNTQDQTIVSGLSDELVLDYVIIDEQPNQRYAVVIDTKIPNKASQKWSFEFC